jgi:acetolactate synthase I/II/III large subunit
MSEIVFLESGISENDSLLPDSVWYCHLKFHYRYPVPAIFASGVAGVFHLPVLPQFFPDDLPQHAGAFLHALLPLLAGKKAGPAIASRRELLKPFKVKQERHERKLHIALKDFETPVHPAQVVRICHDSFDGDAVCVADGGNTAVWANFYTNLRTPNTFLGTTKFGMLGAGIGQALGAAMARPGKQVYCLTGDGAMGYHPQEIETAIRNDLKIVFIVFCDKQWGMVKINQQFALRPLKTMLKKSLPPSETINADLGEIEFDKLARSMGAHGERISSPEELKPALERCLAANKCAVIHADVDPVKHMWAPSLIHFKKMHEEPGG